MTTWDGRGLPPVAQARVERFRSSPLRTSLLGVPPALAIEQVGFDTVGEVMGSTVEQISWAGYAGCGMWGSGAGYWGTGTTQASGSSAFAGYGPYVRAVTDGYHKALARMLMETAALGADGVVGVRLSVDHLDRAREFMALGTAVRARSRTRPARPFTTDLPGTDFAKLVHSGWIPVELQVAIEVAIRHDDWATRQQAASRMFNVGNVEVSGYTELVHHTRQFVREKWARQIAASGADGGIVSHMGLSVWELEPGENHIDHAAEATITGTAISHFATRGHPGTSTLTVLPTRRMQTRR